MNNNIITEAYLANDIKVFLDDLLNLININEEDKKIFFHNVNLFIKAKKIQKEEDEIAKKSILCSQISSIWGSKKQENINLLNKALKWIFKNNENEIEVLNNLVKIGKILTEDELPAVTSVNTNTISDAEKYRANLTSSNEFIEAMKNKSGLKYKHYLQELNALNKIISDKN